MSMSYISIPLVGELLSLVLLVQKIPTTAQIYLCDFDIILYLPQQKKMPRSKRNIF